jgi:hypothetical protein
MGEFGKERVRLIHAQRKRGRRCYEERKKLLESNNEGRRLEAIVKE